MSEDLEENPEEEEKKMKVEDAVNLKSVDFQIWKREFVCIIGEVGSGKSSLISALLGDMIYVAPETLWNLLDKDLNEESLEEMIRLSKDKGIIEVSGTISLVQ